MNSVFRYLFLVTLVVVATLVVSVWLPVITRFYVSVSQPTLALVQQLRTHPNEQILNTKVTTEAFFGSPIPSGMDLNKSSIAALIQQQINKAGISSALKDHRFDDKEMQTGVHSLGFAQLKVPDIYVRAYNATGRVAFLREATQFLLTFSRYERKQWLPDGYLWNDHAIAARIGVLARFWHAYRDSPIYTPSAAREILWHASRCAAMLADPQQFTYATNHGVMQNLALLQFAAAFPAFPTAQAYAKLALRRLKLQFQYYVNAEGIILEHSATYQVVGIRFIGMAIHLAELNHLTVPSIWRTRYKKAIEFLQVLTWPDGTLPILGDTVRGTPKTDLSYYQKPNDYFDLYPVAGYAIWGTTTGKDETQSLVTWSHYPRHGHVVASEMSLLVWSRGRPWITSVGRWPYGTPGRKKAVGWNSSNAPHWVTESPKIGRSTALEKTGNQQGIAALDLIRTDVTGRRIRRQIISVDGSLWIVLDSTPQSNTTLPSETVWTFPPSLTIRHDSRRSSVLTDSKRNVAMHITVAGSRPLETRWYSGSTEPFAGWTIRSATPYPAPALLIRREAGASWSGTVFSIAKKSGTPPAVSTPVTMKFRSATSWTTKGSYKRQPWSVRREGAHLEVTYQGKKTKMSLIDGSTIANQRHRLVTAFDNTAVQFDSEYRDLRFYRTRFTFAIIALLILQELLLGGWKLIPRPPITVAQLRILSLVCWFGIIAWTHLAYFP